METKKKGGERNIQIYPNIELKHPNLHLQHSRQAFLKMHSQHSNIYCKHSINKVKHSKQACKILTCTLNKRLFNSNFYCGHSTFNSTFSWNIQHKYSIQTFNSSNTIQYNNLFAFPCEIRLQEIYIHIFFFYDKMLSNFEICI